MPAFTRELVPVLDRFHPGLHFEKLHGFIESETGDQLYSIRISRFARALVCLNDGPTLVLVTLYVRTISANNCI